jgi:hypothetical protein
MVGAGRVLSGDSSSSPDYPNQGTKARRDKKDDPSQTARNR